MFTQWWNTPLRRIQLFGSFPFKSDQSIVAALIDFRDVASSGTAFRLLVGFRMIFFKDFPFAASS